MKLQLDKKWDQSGTDNYIKWILSWWLQKTIGINLLLLIEASRYICTLKEIRVALQNVPMDTWWNRAFEDFFKDKNLPVLAIKEHQTWTRIIVTPDTLTIWKWF